MSASSSRRSFRRKAENACAIRCNANAALVFELLYRFLSISRSYFGKLDEESVKNNFILIYELLDGELPSAPICPYVLARLTHIHWFLEILDFGYPQNAEIDALKMYITTESVRSDLAVAQDSSKITIQATGATSWRRSDVKYRKNEAFVDVIENVNLLMSKDGAVLRADVDGQIMMRAYLSGTPECKFGLNDKLVLDKRGEPSSSNGGGGRAGDGDSAAVVELDDCQFHQCVRLGKFDSDRSISFIPPDGEFELMKYRSTHNINLPFKLQSHVVEPSKSRVEYTIQLRATFDPKINATHVVLKIPTHSIQPGQAPKSRWVKQSTRLQRMQSFGRFPEFRERKKLHSQPKRI